MDQDHKLILRELIYSFPQAKSLPVSASYGEELAQTHHKLVINGGELLRV